MFVNGVMQPFCEGFRPWHLSGGLRHRLCVYPNGFTKVAIPNRKESERRLPDPPYTGLRGFNNPEGRNPLIEYRLRVLWLIAAPSGPGTAPLEATQKDRIMNVHPEHAKSPAIVRVVELVGVSDKSWSDAAQRVVARASQTIRHITGLDVLRNSAVVREGNIIEYHVNVKVAFVVEPAEIET